MDEVRDEVSCKCENSDCKAKILDSKTLTECTGDNIKPKGKYGPLVAKIPVVISEKRVQIDVESIIRLEEPAIEIKRIKKNVYLTQCKLVPRAGNMRVLS